MKIRFLIQVFILGFLMSCGEMSTLESVETTSSQNESSLSSNEPFFHSSSSGLSSQDNIPEETAPEIRAIHWVENENSDVLMFTLEVFTGYSPLVDVDCEADFHYADAAYHENWEEMLAVEAPLTFSGEDSVWYSPLMVYTTEAEANLVLSYDVTCRVENEADYMPVSVSRSFVVDTLPPIPTVFNSLAGLSINALAYNPTDDVLGYTGSWNEGYILEGMARGVSGEILRQPAENLTPGSLNSLLWAETAGRFYGVGNTTTLGRIQNFTYDSAYARISGGLYVGDRGNSFTDIGINAQGDFCVASNVRVATMDPSSNIGFLYIYDFIGEVNGQSSYSVIPATYLNSSSSIYGALSVGLTQCFGVGVENASSSSVAVLLRKSDTQLMGKDTLSLGGTSESAKDIIASGGDYIVAMESDGGAYLARVDGSAYSVSSSVALEYRGRVCQVIELSDGRFLTIGTRGAQAVVSLVASDLSSARLYNYDGIVGQGEGTSAVQVNDGRVYVSGNDGAGQGWIDIIEP
jgi:hypothetical protein